MERKETGISIDVDNALLKKYVELLLEWNAKVNLISRSDVSNVWRNHIVHSLCIPSALNIEPGTRILDLGTGGGLPGIPLAIIRPDLSITLLDSIRKKTSAIQDMVDSLSLTNVDVITSRAEEIVGTDSRWDLVISRAVAPLEKLIGWSKLLLRNSHKKIIRDSQQRTWATPAMIALKGGNLDNEIAEAQKKWQPKELQVLDINFFPTDPAGLLDKKIILVKL